MIVYVYNRTSNVLHRLPASESCNTDQIANQQRFESNDAYDRRGHPAKLLINDRAPRFCRRCFK